MAEREINNKYALFSDFYTTMYKTIYTYIYAYHMHRIMYHIYLQNEQRVRRKKKDGSCCKKVSECAIRDTRLGVHVSFDT